MANLTYLYEGAEAAKRGKSSDSCPYKRCTEPWFQWNTGYNRYIGLRFLEEDTNPSKMTEAEIQETFVDPPEGL